MPGHELGISSYLLEFAFLPNIGGLLLILLSS